MSSSLFPRAFNFSTSSRASLYAAAEVLALSSIFVVSVKICCTSGVIFTRGSILMVIGCVRVWPFAVRRTVYVPGATQGELTPG